MDNFISQSWPPDDENSTPRPTMPDTVSGGEWREIAKVDAFGYYQRQTGPSSTTLSGQPHGLMDIMGNARNHLSYSDNTPPASLSIMEKNDYRQTINTKSSIAHSNQDGSRLSDHQSRSLHTDHTFGFSLNDMEAQTVPGPDTGTSFPDNEISTFRPNPYLPPELATAFEWGMAHPNGRTNCELNRQDSEGYGYGQTRGASNDFEKNPYKLPVPNREKCAWMKHSGTITTEHDRNLAAVINVVDPPPETINKSKVDFSNASETTILALACKIQDDEPWKRRRFRGYVEPTTGSMQRYAERAISPIFTGVSLIPKNQSLKGKFSVDERRDCLRGVRELLQKAIISPNIPNQLRVLNNMFQECNPSPTSRLSYAKNEHSHDLLPKCSYFPFESLPAEVKMMVVEMLFDPQMALIDFAVHPTQRREIKHNIELPVTLRVNKFFREVTLKNYVIVHKPVGKSVPERKYYGKVYNEKGADPKKLSYPRPFCFNPKIDTLAISYDFRAPKVNKEISNNWYDKVDKALKSNGSLIGVGLKGVRVLEVRDVMVNFQPQHSDISWFLPSVYGDGFLSRFKSLDKLFFTSASSAAWQTGHSIISEQNTPPFRARIIKYLEDTKNVHKGQLVAEENLVVRRYVDPQGNCALASWKGQRWMDFEHEFVSQMATHIPTDMA